MLTDDTRRAIDALSKDELLQEINKGTRSRFQGDKFAYLHTRLEAIKEEEQRGIRQEDLAHKTQELDLAREANQLSYKANKLSKIAIVVSVVSVIIALGTLIFETYLDRSSVP
ncbi:MAG: hypothetical protein HY694_12165 [Deltaproteobacteria bacterium]|nr:hypothetical protein [Deltaproteobacteria bacterium]